VAPLAVQAFMGGFQMMLVCAGSAALVFAVVVGLLLSRPLPALALQSAR
jgi:Na+(H+)/acetate symporter ActP